MFPATTCPETLHLIQNCRHNNNGWELLWHIVAY
jgi:hypothetical protein